MKYREDVIIGEIAARPCERNDMVAQAFETRLDKMASARVPDYITCRPS
jgi:hypothetical protein